MPLTQTTNVGLLKPSNNYPDWDTPILADLDRLDALAAIGGLGIRPAALPSDSLDIRVGAGSYLRLDGSVGTLATPATLTLAPSAASSVYLDASGAEASTTGGYPSGPIVRLGTVTTDAGSVTAVVDDRVVASQSGATGSVYLALAGGTMGAGSAIATAGVGLTIAATSTQKLGFWGVTPAVRPSGSGQAAVGSATAATATLATVGATNSGDVSGNINANLAAINAQLANAAADLGGLVTLANSLRSALVAAGLIKGSA